jgi:AcrR family transcriptional regulator
VKSPRNPELNRSAAFLAVQQVIDQWPVDDPDPSDRASFIRSVARREFGRRGYEVTTVRDIAAAAGLGSGSVYRVIGSKEELLASIMNGFAEKTMAGWVAALDSDSTVVEKLDAAAWLQINVMERFHDEFRIQLAWMRQVPPDMPRFGWSVNALLKHLKSELAAGTKSGELRINGSSAELTARCVIDLTWIPENIVRDIGKRKALDIARDTLLRGVATRTA